MKQVLIAALGVALCGCSSYGMMGRADPMAGFPMGGGMAATADGQAGVQMGGMPAGMMDPNAMMKRIEFQQELMKNPDLPAWYETREKMALAIGDRTFDKGFDRVFDSMVIALGNLGCRVNNMERVSGYLTASAPQLPPDQVAAMKQQALEQYAQAKGYPPSVTQKGQGFDLPMPGSGYGAAGLTLSMVRQGEAQTKVKLRFDRTYYPPEIQQLYQRVWTEVDKQMFLDKALD
jgi:hypothetical protein